MRKATDKIIQKIALPLIVVAGILLIILMIAGTQSTSQQNNAYIRVINCIVSYPAGIRTQADIETCYVIVEKDLDLDLQRYDNSLKH